jgi:hypothetical protein
VMTREQTVELPPEEDVDSNQQNRRHSRANVPRVPSATSTS